jgi:predicted HicB family RNase H-like nuclease
VREPALGLVPFAVKLNGNLVKQLQELAKERGLDMNELVAEVLQKGLAA